jgi:uncharacterized metal-binding protein
MSEKDCCNKKQESTSNEAPKPNCSCGGTARIVLVCSGGSNVGQMTNEAGKILTINKEAKLSCLAGVGGHLSGFVATAKGADKLLVLDGCSLGCAKACVDKAGVENYSHLVLTELGIEKKPVFEWPEETMEMVLDKCRGLLKEDANCLEGETVV